MSEPNDIRDIQMSALIDGELDDSRRVAVERAIKADPGLNRRVEQMRADRELLRRVFEPVARRPIPPQWLAAAYARPRPVSWRFAASIAAALLVAIIGTYSYLELGQRAPAWIVDEALNARQNVMPPEKVIAVAADAKVARYDAVLKQVVRARVRVPDMAKAGYRLAAIRLFPHDSARAAELTYRDMQNHVFTLYVSHSDGSVDFTQLERRGLRVCLWRDDQVSTVMAGNVSTAAMQRLAILAYSGMTA